MNDTCKIFIKFYISIFVTSCLLAVLIIISPLFIKCNEQSLSEYDKDHNKIN